MCTLEKRGNIHILTLTGSGEHRLNPDLIDSIQSALHRLREEPTSPSSVLITTAQGKFFSNGYDLAWAGTDPSRNHLMDAKLQSLVADFISLPMPTIAAVTGHASAAGMILALSHDYVLMREDRGFLYMSEVDIGLVMPEWFVVLLESKIGDYNARREVVLMGAKLTGEKAEARGIVHSTHGGAEDTLEAALKLGQELVRRGWDGHVYGMNRRVLLRKVLEIIRLNEDQEKKTISKL
ncbi:dodecenoyl-CoA isomerase [Turnera subulata]|uniref:Delta(3)-Delta(2)-enoyl-CoA isomerase n=1 Tax=Turnera subulata TaxID=218843 RepID=A0A9Q0FF91_9ROSI|nr:dodecenoyl-CoA isomerase [Turnera subulata]